MTLPLGELGGREVDGAALAYAISLVIEDVGEIVIF